MKNNRSAIIIWLLCSLLANVNAQPAGNNIEQFIQQILDENDGELPAGYDEFLIGMDEILLNPINLNTASADELEYLPFLSPFQILALIDHRNRSGPLLGLFELLYVPGFRSLDVERLSLFTYCGPENEITRKMGPILRTARQTIITGYRRVLEPRQGYRIISNSTDPHSGKKAYLGSPDKFWMKYFMKGDERIQIGLIGEKDAGEEFGRGSNVQGFDFYSGHLQLRQKHGLIRSIIIGDYRVYTGQGLLIWNGFSPGKLPGSGGPAKRNQGIRPSKSVSEYGYLRGAALNMAWRDLSVSVFGSCQYVDASIDTADNSFTSLSNQGLHATNTQLRLRRSLRYWRSGALIRLKTQRLQLGMQTLLTGFDRNFNCNPELYRTSWPQGRFFHGLSIDHTYLGRNCQFFGEAAFSNGAPAILQGAQYYVHTGFSLGAVYRYFSSRYFSFDASTTGNQSRVNNEEGFMVFAHIELPQIYLRMLGDVYRYRWLRYGMPAPASGQELSLEMGTTLTKHQGRIQLRFRQDKESWEGAPVDTLISLFKTSGRFQWNSTINQCFRIQFNIAGVFFSPEIEISEAGYYSSLAFRFQGVSGKIKTHLRFAYFDTESYNSRLYCWEPDLRYAYSFGSYQGEGWSCIVLIGFSPWGKLHIEGRIKHIRFRGADSNGSGSNLILKPYRTEVGFQMVINF